MSFLPAVSVMEGGSYKLVESSLPEGVKNAGIEVAGKVCDLYQIGGFNGSIYSQRTLSVASKITGKIIASLDIGLNYTYLQQDNLVLLYGISGSSNPRLVARYKSKFQGENNLSREDIAMMKDLGLEIVAVLCDLNSSAENPCRHLPVFTTDDQSFVGLNTASRSYVLADGSVSPACLYETGFDSAVANPPNANYHCAINTQTDTQNSKDVITNVKVSGDGKIALMTVSDYNQSSGPKSTVWIY